MGANQIGPRRSFKSCLNTTPDEKYLDWPLLNLPLLLMVRNTFDPKTVCEGVIPNRDYLDWPFQNIPLHRYGQYSWSSLDALPLCSPVFHLLD